MVSYFKIDQLILCLDMSKPLINFDISILKQNESSQYLQTMLDGSYESW